MKQTKIIFGMLFIAFGILISNSISCKKLNFDGVTKCKIENISIVDATAVNVELEIMELSPSDHPDYGICYSTENQNPTLEDNLVSFGPIDEDDKYSKKIENLTVGTKYYIRAYVMNGNQVKYSLNTKEFNTPYLPTISTIITSAVTATSSSIVGTVNAKGQLTTVAFEYGLTTDYGNEIIAVQSPVSGNTESTVSVNIAGLTMGTTYHYRIKATSIAGTVYGNDMAFTTTFIPAPTVTTSASTNISTTSAKLNGTVNANGQYTTVTFEYGLTTNYGSTIAAIQSPVSGSLNVSVSADISSLTANTVYHYRVKAVSTGGTVYGENMSFTTSKIPAPTATTNAAISVGLSSATLNGIVNANGQSTSVSFDYGATASYGLSINADQNPVSGISNTNVSVNLSNLMAGTLYHFRIKASSAGGTIFGNDQVFTTASNISGTVTDIEGNTYKTIIIGTQVWMAENLKSTKFNDGYNIPKVISDADWTGLSTPAYCLYNHEINNAQVYGVLYNWYVVDAYRRENKNVCPAGWHLPTDDEWTVLIDLLDDESESGGKMKETGTVHWTSPNQGATNLSGFTALPAGYRNRFGTFSSIKNVGFWWTTLEMDSENAWYYYVIYNSASSTRIALNKTNGFSLRCLKN